MGGMIAAEMAAIAHGEIGKLCLLAPAGLWLDDHPIVDIFSKLPFELPALLFHDAEIGQKLLTAGGGDMEDPEFLQQFLVMNARRLGMAGKILFPIPDRRLVPAALPHRRQDADRLGQGRRVDSGDLWRDLQKGCFQVKAG